MAARDDIVTQSFQRQAIERLLSAGNPDCAFHPNVGSGVAADVSGNLKLTTLFFPQQHATSGAPAYVKGALYFDTTLNKLRVGGAAGWETVTSV
jgi:hypothetical protein